MHPVIGHSFQFTALHFGTATDPFEFVRVAPHSSVLDHWLYAVTNIRIHPITSLSDSTMARVKCPHGWEVGLLRLWMVYIQVDQPFQNS